MEKALIAMSGGVDSSVAAWLLKNGGYDCIGAMMKLYEGDGGCCSVSDAEDARAVAHRLDIPFYVFNFIGTFTEQVIDRFVAAYGAGLTPNPCIDCNRYMKFERFLHRAGEIGCSHIATGHYARIEKCGGRYLLKKGLDKSKDQSYVLYMMTDEQRDKTMLPLGGLTKAEVREAAYEQGFINAKKRDSQDICFAPDGDYAGFIARHTGISPAAGEFIDTDGKVMGTHRGIVSYTIGQRRGLGLSSPSPLYVCAIDADRETVVVGTDDKLYSKTLYARDINLIAADRLEGAVKAWAKIRYSHAEQPATVRQVDDDTLRVEFNEPVRAITPGQAVVLYDGDTVIGGGTIMPPLPDC